MKYDILADKEKVDKTIASLRERGVEAEFVETGNDAMERVRQLIPDGAEVMTGSSTTLQEIGFVDLLKSKNHPWKNWKDLILAETDPQKQEELRRKSVTSEYFLGSVHAVSEDGIAVVASASGSQLPAYSFSSSNVIWVVGTQKIMPDLESAIKRVKEYVYPLENQRMKSTGALGSVIGKMLIFEKEIMPRKVRLIFVGEKLGF